MTGMGGLYAVERFHVCDWRIICSREISRLRLEDCMQSRDCTTAIGGLYASRKIPRLRREDCREILQLRWENVIKISETTTEMRGLRKNKKSTTETGGMRKEDEGVD